MVIACDGVNSFLAKEAGLLPRRPTPPTTPSASRRSWPCPPRSSRSGSVWAPTRGSTSKSSAAPAASPAAGFLYTNRDTVSVGVVVSVTGLAAAGVRPEELIADFKAHPAIAPWLKGATLKEYGAHLIPEGGYDAMPALAADGLLVAGDAAGLTLAAGIWLEGVNFAIGSGLAAGQTAAAAVASGDVSAAGLASLPAQRWRPTSCSRTTGGCGPPPT